MEEVVCTLCLEQYETMSHEPVMLPCGHTFCRACLLKVEKTKVLTCPVCRQSYSNIMAENLPRNFSMLTVTDYLSSRQTEECRIHKEPLGFWCHKCQETACGLCVFQYHRQDDHDIVSVKVVVEEKREQLKDYTRKIYRMTETLKTESTNNVNEAVASLISAFHKDREILNLRAKLDMKSESVRKGTVIEVLQKCEAEYASLRGKATALSATHTLGDDREPSPDRQMSIEAEEVAPDPHIIKEPGGALTGDPTGAKCAWPVSVSVHNGDGRWGQLTQEDHKLLLSTFSQQFTDTHFIIQWDLLSKLLPSNPQVFLEVSVGGHCMGRVYISLLGHLRRAKHFLALCLGTLGPSYRGTKLCMNQSRYPKAYIVGGQYKGPDGSMTSKGLMQDLEWNGPHARKYQRGLVVSGNSGKRDKDALFGVCTDEKINRICPGTIGEVASGYEILRKAVFENNNRAITITRCGVVIPAPTSIVV